MNASGDTTICHCMTLRLTCGQAIDCTSVIVVVLCVSVYYPLLPDSLEVAKAPLEPLKLQTVGNDRSM